MKAVRDRIEERLGAALIRVRAATALLVALSLLRAFDTEQSSIRRPALAVVAVAVAVADTAWCAIRIRRHGAVTDTRLATIDTAASIVVALSLSLTAPNDTRAVVLLAALPFCLTSVALVALGVGLTARGVIAATAIGEGWALAMLARPGLTLAVELAAFALMFFVALRAGGEFRAMAAQIEAAEAHVEQAQIAAAEELRQADLARAREATHREIHDHLLPIVDMVSRSETDPGLAQLARRASSRARRLLTGGPAQGSGGFEAAIAEVRDTYVEAGLALTSVVRVLGEPPPAITEAIAGAAREALSNVVKYAGARDEVHLFAEATSDGVTVIVRDRGAGFDPAATTPGGGFTRTYAAVQREGGSVALQSRVGWGTKVTFTWPTPSKVE